MDRAAELVEDAAAADVRECPEITTVFCFVSTWGATDHVVVPEPRHPLHQL